MKPVSAADYTVAVVGAGAMGQGIAQVSVQGGLKTLLFDARPGGAAEGAAQIGKRIDRLVEKGRIGDDDASSAKTCHPSTATAGLTYDIFRESDTRILMPHGWLVRPPNEP